jgi:hypothetical protein
MIRTSWIVFGILLLLLINAQAAENTLPPEIKALIGLKFKPEAPGKPLVVPGWQYLYGGAMITNSIAFIELQREEIAVLAIESIDSPDERTILDAKVIQGEFLQSFLKDGKMEWKENPDLFFKISPDCWRKNSNKEEKIVGMWRYKKGHLCDAKFSEVKKAWKLDTESGHLTDIPTKGVSCRGPDDCMD